MSIPINISGLEEFKKEVLSSETLVLVDFWAPWCGPCRLMAPILEKLAKGLTGKLKIVKVNTEQSGNRVLADKYEIQSIPNMKLFKNGEVVEDFIGFRPESVFLEELKSYIIH